MNCNLEGVWKKYSSLLPALIKTFSRSASSRVCQTNARKGIEEISLTLVSCLWPSRPGWQQASLSPVIPRSWLAKNNPKLTTQEASSTTSSPNVCCCLMWPSVVWGHWSEERREWRWEYGERESIRWCLIVMGTESQATQAEKLPMARDRRHFISSKYNWERLNHCVEKSYKNIKYTLCENICYECVRCIWLCV